MPVSPDIASNLESRLSNICDHFLPHFVKADRLAMKYQSYYVKGSKLIYWLAVLAVLAVSGQYIFNLPHIVIVIEILSIVGILSIITIGNKVGWHRRWMDYRLLAERFRFAVFMAMVGETVSKRFSKSDIHHAQKHEHWVFSYFGDVWDKWEAGNSVHPEDVESLRVMKRFIALAWLESQHGYHVRNVGRQWKKHKQLSVTGTVLFVLTLVAVIMHLFGIGGHGLSPYLTFMAILFPATGSALSALRAHFEHNRLARRSEAIAEHLKVMLLKIEKVHDREGLHALVHEAEELMLNDNAEWHVMVGLHHLEPPG